MNQITGYGTFISCLLATLQKKGWMDFHEILLDVTQGTTSSMVSHLTRPFHAAPTRGGGVLRSRSATCLTLISHILWKIMDIGNDDKKSPTARLLIRWRKFRCIGRSWIYNVLTMPPTCRQILWGRYFVSGKTKFSKISQVSKWRDSVLTRT